MTELKSPNSVIILFFVVGHIAINEMAFVAIAPNATEFDLTVYNEVTFNYACGSGYLEMAKWLLQINPKINIYKNNAWSFSMSCRKGQLQIAQWLWHDVPKIHDFILYDDVFENTCIVYDKDPKIAMWLLDIRPEIHISAMTFVSICRSGELDLAKKAWKLNPDMRIFVDCIDLFQTLCYVGEIHMAKWVLEICPKIDIAANKHNAFRIACVNHRWEVAAWLQQFFPYQYFIQTVQGITTYSHDRIDYDAIRARMDAVPNGAAISLREALMRNRFHPRNMDKWIGWGIVDPDYLD
jgi:hypothetical protein